MFRNKRQRPCMLTCMLLCLGVGSGEALTAHGWSVIYAPGVYEHLPQAGHHSAAAVRLRKRLTDGGFPADQVVLLEGKSATASRFRETLAESVDAAAPDDVFLVVLLTHGIQFGEVDYVCASDTPLEVEAEIASSSRRLIGISEILEEMTFSASATRLLVVDGAGISSGPLHDASLRFGRLPLHTSDGQWVIINRGRRMGLRGGQRLTSFAMSILDGLVFHADGNRDGNVSLLELAAYMKLFADGQQDVNPTFAGKSGQDAFVLSKTQENDDTFPTEQLAANARKLLEEAEKTLFLDLDVRAALALLDRANRLTLPGELELRRAIKAAMDSSRILNGDAVKVLPQKKEPGKRWTAVLPRPAVHREPGWGATQQLPAGTVVEITMTLQDFAGVVAAWTPRLDGDAVKLVPRELKAGWIPLAALAVERDRVVPDRHLLELLSDLSATTTGR